MAREVPVEIEVARAAYLAALDRWFDDPHRQQVFSRSRIELSAAGRLLRAALRDYGVASDQRMPEPPFG